MSTHALIGIKEDQQVKALYVHWDGGLWGAGAALAQDYREDDKIRCLIDLGGCSALMPGIPLENISNGAYDEPPTVFSLEDWQNAFANWEMFASAEYFYLWDGAEWTVAQDNGLPPEKLETALADFQAKMMLK